MITIGLLDLLLGKDYQDVTYQQLVAMLQERNKYQFVDVRTKKEFKHGHIRGFNKNIDYYKAKKLPSMLERINKDIPVVLICATGSRSNDTCRMLKKMGYEEVYNYKKGLRAWNGSLVK